MTTDRTQGRLGGERVAEADAAFVAESAVEPVHRAITKDEFMVRTACNVTWAWVPNETRRATYANELVTCSECLRTLRAAGVGL